MSWNERLKEKRVVDALTQEELAKMIGVSRQHLALWESGRQLPSPTNRRKIAEYIGKPVHEAFADLLTKEES
ncbi:helix-turn-helix protein [Exiguobacterium phage vB_EauM-23]|nr:helix-turn-helix protein [Exiguobacterium phage vB_EauM-23]